VPAKPSVVIIQLRKLLEAAARDIRYLLNLDVCDSDDEDADCVEPDDYCNIPTIPEVEVDYSGSGEPPTLDFTSSTEVSSSNSSINSTSTVITVSPTVSSSSSSTVSNVPRITNRPPRPTLPNELTPPPKTEDTDQPEISDENEEDGTGDGGSF